MTIEEKLKELILKRYHSIREFTIAIDIPYTTVDSLFRRGLANSSVSTVIRICKALHISADALADGEIRAVKDRPLVPTYDMVEITDILSDAKDALIHSGKLTLDGNPIGKAGIESIIDAIEVGVEIAKRKTAKKS